MSIAWVFPGQGSQKKGMADHILNLPGAKERFDLASNIIGRDLLAICRGEGLEAKTLSDINDTRNTQPALFLIESILIDELRRQGNTPSLMAGHSLGELVALYAAEVIDAESALSLLFHRSELMAAAGGGSMTAVLGFDRAELESLVSNTEGVVIANDNSDSQIVLSGTPEAVNTVSSQLTCKRAIPLAVSGAFHSPLMKKASKSFAEKLDQVAFNNAKVPLLSNSDPTPSCEAEILKKRLKQQMTTGVRWRETMSMMMERGITSLIEIGPGNVLSGLAKRSMTGITTKQISTANDLGK